MAQGPWCMVLASRFFLLQLIKLGGELTSPEMARSLTHLDTLSWTTVLLELNSVMVRVPDSLAPLILAGFVNIRSVTG